MAGDYDSAKPVIISLYIRIKIGHFPVSDHLADHLTEFLPPEIAGQLAAAPGHDDQAFKEKAEIGQGKIRKGHIRYDIEGKVNAFLPDLMEIFQSPFRCQSSLPGSAGHAGNMDMGDIGAYLGRLCLAYHFPVTAHAVVLSHGIHVVGMAGKDPVVFFYDAEHGDHFFIGSPGSRNIVGVSSGGEPEGPLLHTALGEKFQLF